MPYLFFSILSHRVNNIYICLTYFVQEEVDIYNAEFPSHIPPQLWRRSNIVEIIGAKELILACTKSGLCVALNRCTIDEQNLDFRSTFVFPVSFYLPMILI